MSNALVKSAFVNYSEKGTIDLWRLNPDNGNLSLMSEAMAVQSSLTVPLSMIPSMEYYLDKRECSLGNSPFWKSVKVRSGSMPDTS
jgi:hypothetical protein